MNDFFSFPLRFKKKVWNVPRRLNNFLLKIWTTTETLNLYVSTSKSIIESLFLACFLANWLVLPTMELCDEIDHKIKSMGTKTQMKQTY